MEWTEIILLHYGIGSEPGHLGDWYSIHGETENAVRQRHRLSAKLTR